MLKKKNTFKFEGKKMENEVNFNTVCCMRRESIFILHLRFMEILRFANVENADFLKL